MCFQVYDIFSLVTTQRHWCYCPYSLAQHFSSCSVCQNQNRSVGPTSRDPNPVSVGTTQESASLSCSQPWTTPLRFTILNELKCQEHLFGLSEWILSPGFPPIPWCCLFLVCPPQLSLDLPSESFLTSSSWQPPAIIQSWHADKPTCHLWVGRMCNGLKVREPGFNSDWTIN